MTIKQQREENLQNFQTCQCRWTPCHRENSMLAFVAHRFVQHRPTPTFTTYMYYITHDLYFFIIVLIAVVLYQPYPILCSQASIHHVCAFFLPGLGNIGSMLSYPYVSPAFCHKSLNPSGQVQAFTSLEELWEDVEIGGVNERLHLAPSSYWMLSNPVHQRAWTLRPSGYMCLASSLVIVHVVHHSVWLFCITFCCESLSLIFCWGCSEPLPIQYSIPVNSNEQNKSREWKTGSIHVLDICMFHCMKMRLGKVLGCSANCKCYGVGSHELLEAEIHYLWSTTQMISKQNNVGALPPSFPNDLN